MAKRFSGRGTGAVFWLQLLTGVYLFTLGLAELFRFESGFSRMGRDISGAFGGGSDVITLLAGLVLIAGGAVLVLVLFTGVGAGMYRYLTLAVLILWIIKIISVLFVNNFLAPDFLTWVSNLALNGIVGVSLWMFSAARH